MSFEKYHKGLALKSYSKRCGFTLIEILIVIAIILTLAGILLAALSGLREGADDTIILGNASAMSKLVCEHDLGQRKV